MGRSGPGTVGSSTYLRLPQGHEEAAHLPEDADRQPARAELTGAQEDQGQALHRVQHARVRAPLGRAPGAAGGPL
jgi:hypothetical protein